MRRYSPPYYSPPRRGYGGRPRSPPRLRSPPRRGYGGDGGGYRGGDGGGYRGGDGGGYRGGGGGGGGYRGGRKEQNQGSLLVRNIPLDCRSEELRIPFERFGVVRDVYIPKDYYSGEPRGFAFVQFVDSVDAMEAQHRMNGEIFAGREITVVVAAETRKRPEDMRHRTRTGRGSYGGGGRSSHHGRRSLSRSRSPPRRPSSRSQYRTRSSYSPSPRRRDDYSVSPSPSRRHPDHPRSSRGASPAQQDVAHDRRSYSPGYDGKGVEETQNGNDYAEKAAYDSDNRPRGVSRSPPSRSRSRSRSRSLPGPTSHPRSRSRSQSAT